MPQVAGPGRSYTFSVQKAVELHAQGKTYAEIARILGCKSRQMVWAAVKGGRRKKRAQAA